MLLLKGEKIHVVHRRLFEKDIRKHFVGEVEDYEDGLVRATGYVFMIDDPRENVFRKRAELRTRIFSLHGGNIILNVIPPTVELAKVRYESHGHCFRVTDGSEWQLEIKEFGWA
ncbi:MAG: hypothetical protein HY043_00275 [Verrucomicrobia bacterium]|nr:hypothetical protein [Verrucomicrobiota bacterium]